jgi:Ca2+/H+ antiporter
MEKQLRQQAVIFLMFSLRVHKKSKVEKERRKAEAEEKKKNAKYKPGKKPAPKKSTTVAIAPKTLG